jgi:hypothetical protein
MGYRYMAQSWQSLRRSESSTDKPPVNMATASHSSITAQYVVLTFLNAHILDDNFRLSWYNLHPYELLEILSTEGIVRLPREVVVHYVRPYFEANVARHRLHRDSLALRRVGRC